MRHHESSNEWNPDVARVARELADRLHARGIEIYEGDTPDDVRDIADAVEEFENVVQAQGGDLMVDEPPADRAQPDDERFLLPMRGADETAKHFVKRLERAADSARSNAPGS